MAATSTSVSLKDYLKRYESGPENPQKSKKKKKKKPKLSSTTATATAPGVLIVDEDPVWQKPVELLQSESESSEEDKPQVDEDIDVKRMKRLEAIRSRKPYHSISEDGSGWVSISQPSRLSEVKENASDLSPPRQRARFDTPSPEREKRSPNRRDREGDLSPPRRRDRQHSPEVAMHQGSPTVDLSPPRRVRRISEEPDDLSPRRGKASENLSPRRSRRQHSLEDHRALGLRDADLSPPRRSRKSSDVDLAPPGRQHSRDDDLSPPRRRDKDSKSDLSPLRQRYSQDADLSPPRRSHKDSKGGLSPPTRRHSQDADLSPPRRSHKDSKGDLGLPRRRHSHDADLSPPRRSSKGLERDLSPRPRPFQDDLSPPRRTRKENAVGKDAQVRRTGLLSAQDIREDITKKKKEELLRFAAMDPSVSGKGAEPVFRDKEGRRISKEEKLKMNEPEEKPKEKKLEWGKGLAQRREAEARVRELELESDKPFARTRDDPELDKMLKERVRWGDPMAHLVKRKHSEPALMDFGEDEKMKESGFIIPQTVPAHSWIKRGLDFPPNRYGIRPGRHWDGVDRSNGCEKELFKRQNEKRATEAEAYLWSVSDM